MPYSSTDHARWVASTLSVASLIRTNLDSLLMVFYSNMTLPQTDLHGKLAIVTGANSGIGFEAARALVGMGARVVLACRSESRGQEAKRKIVEATGSDNVEVELLDCGSYKSVRAFLDRWEQRESKQVDILINNAGGLTSTVALTEDGLEQNYQANHLSHVLLTHTLLNRGRFSPNARIVSVSSVGFYGSDPLDEHNTNASDVLVKYQNRVGATLSFSDMMQLYARSKASQAVWTMVLQRRLSETERWKNISVHSCHPGLVKSSIWTQPTGTGSATGFLANNFKKFANLAGISNEQGAVVPVWLAVAAKPADPKLRGLFWDRMKWKWVKPWSLEVKTQDKLLEKWCEDAQVPLLL